jgi:hypothetical protein
MNMASIFWFEVLMTVTMKSTVLWIEPLRNSEEAKRFEETYHFHLLLDSCLAYSSALKTGAICSY